MHWETDMSEPSEAVRRAALGLVRALMREAGIKPQDLMPPDAPRKRAAPRPKPKPAAVPGAQLVAELVTAVPAPVVPMVALAAVVDAVTPAGVKLTVAPVRKDGRYLVDAATFEGGALMAEWRARRGGA